MVKSHTFMTWLHLLLVSSIATVGSRPITLSRRGLSENRDPLLKDCDDDQWPFSPISTINPFISRPFYRRPTPPLLLPSPPPPPAVSDPNFSPLVASPPPPGTTINPPTFPELPPDDDVTNASPPLVGLIFSPPAEDNFAPEITLPPIVHHKGSPETTLPPIVHRSHDLPDLYLSPPQLNLPPGPFDVPPPPLVPIVSQQLKTIMPPPPAGK